MLVITLHPTYHGRNISIMNYFLVKYYVKLTLRNQTERRNLTYGVDILHSYWEILGTGNFLS
jgi:hypothetical protein